MRLYLDIRKDEAHRILDLVRAGVWVDDKSVDMALLTLGDWDGRRDHRSSKRTTLVLPAGEAARVESVRVGAGERDGGRVSRLVERLAVVACEGNEAGVIPADFRPYKPKERK
jgi:hypothetical protein